MSNLTLLIKPVSDFCNIDCDYCFYKKLIQSKKDICVIMDILVQEQLIKKALKYAKTSCTFIFQGGEPMCAGIDFYKKFIHLQNKYNSSNIKIHNIIQTNGIFIDDEWAEFFKANDFLVGVSLDGRKDNHDLFRKDYSGNGTHFKVLNGIDILTKHAVQYNILCVITENLTKEAYSTYTYFKKKGFKFIQFIPCISDFNTDATYKLTPNGYATFLKNLFDTWYNDLEKGIYVSIQMFDYYVKNLNHIELDNCAYNGICGNYFVVELNGDIFPCDFYVVEQYKLANIMDSLFCDIIESKIYKQFRNSSQIITHKCTNCDIFYLCKCGCKRYRNIDNINIYCNTFKEFFKYSLHRFEKVALYYY